MVSLVFIAGELLSQNNPDYDQLKKVVDNYNEELPYDFGENFTVTKIFIDEKYYTMEYEIKNISYFRRVSNNKHGKKTIMSELTKDVVFPDLAKLILACNLEIRYLYVYKQDGLEHNIIISRKDIKKILKWIS